MVRAYVAVTGAVFGDESFFDARRAGPIAEPGTSGRISQNFREGSALHV